MRRILLVSFFLLILTVTSNLSAKKQQYIHPPKKISTPVFIVSPQDFTRVQSSQLPVLLDVHADWCFLSRKMLPILNQAAHIFNKSIRFAKILIESFEDSDPTIKFLKK